MMFVKPEILAFVFLRRFQAFETCTKVAVIFFEKHDEDQPEI